MKMYGRLADAAAKRDAEIEDMAADYIEKYGLSVTEAMGRAEKDLKRSRSQATILKGLPVRKIKKVG